MRTELLFLDFDGVICDSVDECFVSSWIAYDLYMKADRTSCKTDFSKTFASYRPFIRRGADYVLLQHCIERNVVLNEQEDFNREEQHFGQEIMDRFHDLFYQAREHLLATQRPFWISLNRLYPGMKQALTMPEPHWHILSTKKSEFIIEILAAEGITWDPDRVHYSGKDKKIPFIENVMALVKADSAIFVDDQIDHFRGFANEHIRGVLANWGYVKKEWLTQTDVEVISLETLVSCLHQKTPLPLGET